MNAAPQPYLRGHATRAETLTLSDTDLFPSLDAAYAAQSALLNETPDLWRAWKLGGTNHGSRAVFGVDRLYYGAIAQDEILETPEIAPARPLHTLQGEVEIALRLDQTATGYDAWCVALEMPASPVLNMPDAGVRALVADRCATGVLILGSAQPLPLPVLAAARFTLEANGTKLDTAGLDQLTDPPEVHLRDFLSLARRHNLPLHPGDWVATGGITRCLPLPDGALVRVYLDGTPHIETRMARETTDASK